MGFGSSMQLRQGSAITVGSEARISFIRKTYGHLFSAILAFVGLEYFFFSSGFADRMMAAIEGVPWLLILGGFMLAGFLAQRLAQNTNSIAVQYMGLGGYVMAESLLFVPLLYIAKHYSDDTVIPCAAITTLAVFIGLTMTVFITKQDFSFLRTGIMIGAFAGLGLIVAGAIFGFGLGLWFSVAMAGLAALFILYDTSNVLRYYGTNQHVAASLNLFASVALLFWYILMIFMSRD